MGINLLLKILIIAIVVIVPWAILWFIPWTKVREKLHERKMNKLRRTALKYIALLHKIMIEERYPRQKRRQFWREFVTQGRFE